MSLVMSNIANPLQNSTQVGATSKLPPSAVLGFLHARAKVPKPKTVQNFRMRLVRIDRVEVGMAGQDAPSELFPDIVHASLRIDLDLVAGFGTLHTADDL